MTNEQLNAIVRRLWVALAREDLGDGDLIEVVCRLQLSCVFAEVGGDPKAAAKRLYMLTSDMLEALKAGMKVDAIVLAKKTPPPPARPARSKGVAHAKR